MGRCHREQRATHTLGTTPMNPQRGEPTMRRLFGAVLLSAVLPVCSNTSYAESDADRFQITTAVAESEESIKEEEIYRGVSAEVWEDESEESWLDTTYVWVGADVYKSIGERITNINGGTGALTSSPGLVTGFNTGVGLVDDWGLRGQFGASVGLYDPKGRLGIVPSQNTAESQVFITTGVYKRGDMINEGDRISYGVVLDYFHANDWGVNTSAFDLTQLRGVFGYALNESTEVGLFGAFGLNEQRAAVTVAGAPGVRRPIRAMDNINLYVKKTYGPANVTGYIGILDGIGEWQVGMFGQAPLSEHWSLYTNVNYVSPSAKSGPRGSGEEQYNFGAGLCFFFSRSNPNGLPLLNVANNGSFLITD